MISLILALLIIFIALSAGLFIFRKKNNVVSDSRSSISTNPHVTRKLAHDIRTPLSIIKTNSEIALMNPSLDYDTKRKFKDIITELDKVSEILTHAVKAEKSEK